MKLAHGWYVCSANLLHDKGLRKMLSETFTVLSRKPLPFTVLPGTTPAMILLSTSRFKRQIFRSLLYNCFHLPMWHQLVSTIYLGNHAPLPEHIAPLMLSLVCVRAPACDRACAGPRPSAFCAMVCARWEVGRVRLCTSGVCMGLSVQCCVCICVL